MIIAGGAYHELCQFPPDSAFFGSGIRAAAATETTVSSRNQLHTCIGPADKETLETYAATFNFDVTTTEIPETVSFDYLHNHSNPVLSRPRQPTITANFQELVETQSCDSDWLKGPRLFPVSASSMILNQRLPSRSMKMAQLPMNSPSSSTETKPSNWLEKTT